MLLNEKWLGSSQSKQSHEYFSSTYCTLIWSRNALCVLHISLHRMLKRCAFKGWGLIKLFLLFKDIPKWNQLLKIMLVHGCEKYSAVTTGIFGTIALVLSDAQGVCPSLLLQHQCKCQHSEKSKQYFSFIMN